jgi:tetratricopeptide (TPR) repeat protein
MRHERLAAEAMKYLELARKSSEFFGGTLGGVPGDGRLPGFPDFEALLQRERINRAEVAEPPPRPATPQAYLAESEPIWESYEAVHKQPSQEDTMALDCIDALLHFGIPSFVEVLVTEASEAYGFLLPATLSSERCRLMRVRTAMMQRAWDRAEELIQELFKTTNRIRQAYNLLGESRYRAVRDVENTSAADYAGALDAFRSALDFGKPGDSSGDAAGGAAAVTDEDPVTHLRVAMIYFMRAEESGFSDEAATATALDHLKQSLLISPTAEAWRCAGVCAYQKACLRRNRLRSAQKNSGDAAAGGAGGKDGLNLKPEALFGDAVRFLAEANVLDRRRPQISAWLAICCCEMGRVQIAKQTIRQVLRFGDQLDASSAVRLAATLLRFSDERQALAGERPMLVEEGRYARESIAVAKLALAGQESFEARFILARAHVMLQEDRLAITEFREAIQQLPSAPSRQEEVASLANACAARLVAEPEWAALIQQELVAIQDKIGKID